MPTCLDGFRQTPGAVLDLFRSLVYGRADRRPAADPRHNHRRHLPADAVGGAELAAGAVFSEAGAR